MTERVAKLREKSIQTKPFITSERAELITEFYSKEKILNLSPPIVRALAFKHILENKAIFIDEDELIVGERGPYLKAVPTYPEICCHTLEDLNILNSREKISYHVSDEVKNIYKEKIIPFWQGKTIRELIFREMSVEWKDAYSAGIFTEFMEQRAPGHTVLDGKIYRNGFIDFKREIINSINSLDYHNDPEAYEKEQELRAMLICCDAIINFAHRYSELAKRMAESEKNLRRKNELEKIAEICSHVPAHPPHDFYSALQAYWFVHLGVIIETNPWDSFCPGRLDQHLYPFYKKDIEEGRLTKEEAKELLECFWIKFNNQPAPPKVGITSAESATYNDFSQINLGGLKEDGSDGVNELSYLILDVVEEMRLIQPNPSIQLSIKNPDSFLKRACEVISKGFGQPSVFNAEIVIQELLRQGKSIEDARQGGTSGCVETGCFGKESYILTGYLNLVKILEITLNNGYDLRTGKKIGIETGDPKNFRTFDELFNSYRKQLEHFVNIKIRGNNKNERIYANHLPVPFLSILIDDCIKKGKDYNDGGARYNTNYIMPVGLATLTDCFSSIKFHVFDKGDVKMEELLGALSMNFEEYEPLRQKLWNKTPKFGNDNDYADGIMRDLFNLIFLTIEGRKNTKGGVYHVNYLSTTCHVYFGSVTGATPDGRKDFTPVSDGISPSQGVDRLGPTAVIKSVSKMDHALSGGTLLNLKFTPSIIEGEEGIERLAQLIRSHFRLGAHHVQFNVVSAEILREAQKNPEKYRDLIVRVAGFSEYFCNLSRAVQDEIIARTEHSSV
ncbi:MAG: trans-4-hydroxy-L-proline dehydratase [Candidatus Aminicenantia bacterium]